jgi:hypothetical protein
MSADISVIFVGEDGWTDMARDLPEDRATTAHGFTSRAANMAETETEGRKRGRGSFFRGARSLTTGDRRGQSRLSTAVFVLSVV